MDDLEVVVIVVMVDSLLQPKKYILDYMCIWSVYKEKTIKEGWCVMDGSWSWGNGEYGSPNQVSSLLFCFLSAGKVASRGGKVVSATSQLEASFKRLRDV